MTPVEVVRAAGNNAELLGIWKRLEPHLAVGHWGLVSRDSAAGLAEAEKLAFAENKVCVFTAALSIPQCADIMEGKMA